MVSVKSTEDHFELAGLFDILLGYALKNADDEVLDRLKNVTITIEKSS